MEYQSKFKKYQKKASEVLQDNHRVQRLLSDTGKKLTAVLESSDRMKDFSEKIYVMIRMVKAQFSGVYRAFPWRSILLIVAALLYFVTPFDIIPDFIPALGLTDDISIVYWIYRSIQEDIDKFESWENTIEIS